MKTYWLKEYPTNFMLLFGVFFCRLLKEITNFCSTVQQQEQKWQSSLQELLAEAAMSQKQDIKQFLEKLCSSDRKGDSKQRAAADTQVLTQTIRKEIQLLLTKQAKTVEKCVQDLLKHQLYDQGQQLKNLQAALVTDMTLSVEAAARHFSSDLVMPLSLPKFEKKMEEISLWGGEHCDMHTRKLKCLATVKVHLLRCFRFLKKKISSNIHQQTNTETLDITQFEKRADVAQWIPSM